MGEMDTYYIITEIQKLEQEKLEEQFHYDSIPLRRKKTLAEVKTRLICMGLILLADIFFIIRAVGAFQRAGEGAGMLDGLGLAVRMIVYPILAVGLTILFLILLMGLLEELDLLVGAEAKSSNFGARNFADEKKKSEEKLQNLNRQMEQLRGKLRDIRQNQSYEEQKKKKEREALSQKLQNQDYEGIAKEDFLAYAYGTWGEDAEKIRLNLINGTYEAEKEQLLQKLETEKMNLSRFGRRILQINHDYKDFIHKCVVFGLILVGIIMFQWIFFDIPRLKYIFALLGFFYALIGGFLIYRSGKDAVFYYRLEYQYHKVQSYAEQHHFLPISKQKKNLLQRIEDINKRLLYVEQVLEMGKSLM